MIACTNCSKHFSPSQEQSKFIKKAIEKGMQFIMLECPCCGLSFGINPSGISVSIAAYLPLRTPLPGCLGFISELTDDSGPFWGCGESGAIWRKKENLYRDIEKIIQLYPHRSSAYIKINSEWLANPNEPDDLEDLIAEE